MDWINEIENGLQKHYESERVVHPVYGVRASQIGRPTCQIYQSIKNWKYAEPFGRSVLQRFEDGNLHEVAVLALLEKIGFQALRRQMTGQVLRYNVPIITATLDTILKAPNGEMILAEIKSVSCFSFDKLNSIEDLLANKFYAAYYDQIQIYLEAFHDAVPKENGALLIMKNKNSGQLKTIFIPYDAERVAMLKEKAHSIKRAIESPEAAQLEWLASERLNDSECIECPYKIPCKPEIKMDALQIKLGDDEMIELLKIRAENEKAANDFRRADDKVKSVLKSQDFKRTLYGDFIIEKKISPMKKYEIPESVKSQYIVPGGERVAISIKQIGVDTDEV